MNIKLLLVFMLMQSLAYADTSMSDLFNKYSNTAVDKKVAVPEVVIKQEVVAISETDSNTITIKAKPFGPWIADIKKLLAEKGVRVKGYSSKDKTKFELHLNAYAPTGFWHNCFGGGYQFDYYIAELIDSTTGKVISVVEDSGYSEGCQPVSGTMYTRTVNMIGAVIELSDISQDNSQPEITTEEKSTKNWN